MRRMLRRGRGKAKTKKELGKIGEDHAARYLASRGYRIRERNVSAAGVEVDIVAEHRDVLVFVEVKARSSGDYMEPGEGIKAAQQRRIVRAAASYLASREHRERNVRFDVVEVFLTPQGRVERLNLMPGAFEAG